MKKTAIISAVVIMVVVPLFSFVRNTTAQSPFEKGTVLIRIDLSDEENAIFLESFGVTVLAQLFNELGKPLFIALASAAQQEELLQAGYTFEILDAPGEGQTYALLLGKPAALEASDSIVPILFKVGDVAVAKAGLNELDILAGSGIESQLLVPQMSTAQEVQDILLRTGALAYDPLVKEMIQQVHASTLNNYDGGLSGEWPVIIDSNPYTIATRYTYAETPIKKATKYAFEHFESLGLPVGYQYYTVGGYERRNVIAEQAGSSQPGKIFLITAHLDSTSNNPTVLAPGADDNASGSAGVLAAADILSQYEFGCTLRYVLFTGEEQGLYGSRAYAAQAYNRGENIAAVLNLDMIAYDQIGAPIVDLHARSVLPASITIAEYFANVVSIYGLNLSPQILVNNSTGDFSDNKAFWENGYPAILAMEDWDDFTPYYHKTTDRLTTLNLAYFAQFVKAAVGTMAHMGCLLEGSLQGSVTDSSSGNPISGAVVKAIRSDIRSWQTTTGGNGSYRLVLQPGTFQVEVSAPTYKPVIANDVNIFHNQAKTINFSLDKCQTLQGVDFAFNPSLPWVGENVEFSASISSGTAPVFYSWQFGDGSVADGQFTSHSYNYRDNFQVELTAHNACTNPQTKIKVIPVTGFAQFFPFVQVDAQ